MASKKYAQAEDFCVACGACRKVCPMSAITIWKGIIADIDKDKCVGCGKCAKECPAGAIELHKREEKAC